MNTQSHQPNPQPAVAPAAVAPESSGAKTPYVTPVLTNHGRLTSLTQQIGVSGGGGGTETGGTGPE